MDKKTCKRLLQIAFKTRQNATESAMEYKNVHRTFFIEKLFFSVFIGVCGLFLSAMKNATIIILAVAVSHSTFASCSLKY